MWTCQSGSYNTPCKNKLSELVKLNLSCQKHNGFQLWNFLIFLSIASQKAMREDDDGLLSLIRLLINDIGPGLAFMKLCCCI